ncbi:hypothetical protein H4R18_002091 [Coemansia javaensis]|uniref:Urease accessory protein UreD n=1 Tax=Coemansia javaensis TaxID=2761396 RepID=A0A9W8HG57_9FUNG|nr:hypothetical protein H4R18_002091 [Coemansia javaensis]
MGVAGRGRLDCRVVAGRVRVVATSAYPLKIIAPQAAQTGPQAQPGEQAQRALHPAAAYVLTYGGGLVHGDRIRVDVHAGAQVALVLLTQGSTKVYRASASGGVRAVDAAQEAAGQTYQTIEITAGPGALVCVLPDPVTCFAAARYSQRQRVRMGAGASLVLLDWMTSGRMSRGERWRFSKYFSANVVCDAAGRIAVRDAMLLEDGGALEPAAAVDALAYLLLLGPAAAPVAAAFRRAHRAHRIRPHRPDPAAVKWSVSEVAERGLAGVAVRAAAASTAALRAWLVDYLAPLQAAIGDAAWSMFANA